MAKEKTITVFRKDQERKIRADQLANWQAHGWQEKPKAAPKAKPKSKAD